MPISWTKDLDTGIDVIDEQHRQLVELINQLESVKDTQHADTVHRVVEDCVQYTMSHFAFEEEIQQEAGYKYCRPHKKVHELFTRRVGEYRQRLDSGENVAVELHSMLANWLINHIKHDDADYIPVVKANISSIIEANEANEGRGWMKRFFSRG
jgi:hemerythrin